MNANSVIAIPSSLKPVKQPPAQSDGADGVNVANSVGPLTKSEKRT